LIAWIKGMLLPVRSFLQSKAEAAAVHQNKRRDSLIAQGIPSFRDTIKNAPTEVGA